MNKIVQFQYVMNADGSGIIYALTDDGTLFWKNDRPGATWVYEADIEDIAVSQLKVAAGHD